MATLRIVFVLGLIFGMFGDSISQTYRINKPPISGITKVNKLANDNFLVNNPKKGIDITSDSTYVYSSVNGRVLRDFQVVNSYIVLIKNKDLVWAYVNLDSTFVHKGDSISLNQRIGRLQYDSGLHKYNLNLQLYKDKKLLSTEQTLKILNAKIQKK